VYPVAVIQAPQAFAIFADCNVKEKVIKGESDYIIIFDDYEAATLSFGSMR